MITISIKVKDKIKNYNPNRIYKNTIAIFEEINEKNFQSMCRKCYWIITSSFKLISICSNNVFGKKNPKKKKPFLKDVISLS